MIQSESTCVPPVTAERSPPLSRMTGADSPVIAASSTEATPSITSPSRRDEVAGLDQHDVAGLEAGAGHEPRAGRRRRGSSRLACGLGPRPAQRVGLRLAAALGHRLGEVGEQHGEPEPEDDLEREAAGPPPPVSEVAEEQDGGQRCHDLDDEHHRVADQSRAGRACRNASPIAGTEDAPGRRASGRAWRVGHGLLSLSTALAVEHREVLDDRAERERREEGEAADDQDDADQQADEQRRRGSGRCRPTAGTRFLAASEPAIASTGTITQKRPSSIARPSGQCCRRACWR